ncbi:hypothetical protein MRB53_033351 [Persea americana]|uniref:Uncharacterized protein n=1 Tax=Persea americana TaxID=3435 RepID=A0ACC2KU94_PERAE|nr:hypothetical protein MRB53_033351 [Persea americana]
MPRTPAFLLTRHQLLSLIQTCPNISLLKQIQSHVLIRGLWCDNFIVARLIAFCATSNSGDLDYARLLFDHSPNPSPYAFNTIIRGYASSSTPIQSIHIFHAMLANGIYPDKYTFPFLLKACTRTSPASFYQGPALHSLLTKCGFDRDLHVQTSLLHTYASSNCILASKGVFDEMPQRSTVTWNALISCYSKLNLAFESLVLFGEMVMGVVEVNVDTLVSVLGSCTSLGALMWGRCVHGFIVRKHAAVSVGAELGTSLVHMYAKCGNLDNGVRVFDAMEVRDVSAWTAMIGGLAMHGHGKEALSHFQTMVEEGMKPDSVTFTSVLHACSHSGLVQEGLVIFHSMREVHEIEARIEHFGIMVDLLGRAGLVREAERFVKSMPMHPNGVIWGTLLNACVINGELGMGERIAERILELGLEDFDGSVYVVMSNIYAKVAKWDEVGKVREVMVNKGVKKACGHSFVEVNGIVHKFLVGDTTHPHTNEIYRLLHRIAQEIKLECYCYSSVLF